MDRFRSMPMAPSAVVTGRGVTDILRAGLDLVVLAVIAVVIGWRSDGGLAKTLVAFGLLLLLNVINPGTVETMTRNPLGQGALVFAGGLFTVGFVVIRRMTRIES